MFNIKKLVALSESAVMNESVGAIILAPYGTISETIDDTSAAISSLSSEIDQQANIGELVGMNASIENPDAVEAIEESILGSMWESIKKFFTKIYEWIKGIIEKIKTKLGMMSSDRDKFLAAIDKAITAKSGKVIDPEFSWEGHKWSRDFIAGTVEEFNTEEGIEIFKKIHQSVKDMNFHNFIEAGSKYTTEKIEEELEDIKNERDEFLKDLENIVKGIKGEEVLTNRISDYSFDTMKQFVKNSSKMSEKIKEGYDKLRDVVEKLRNETTKKADEFEKENMKRTSKYSEISEDKIEKAKGSSSEGLRRNQGYSTKYGFDVSNSDVSARMRANLNAIQKKANITLEIINKASSTYQTLISQCTKEFMGAMRKYVANLK